MCSVPFDYLSYFIHHRKNSCHVFFVLTLCGACCFALVVVVLIACDHFSSYNGSSRGSRSSMRDSYSDRNNDSSRSVVHITSLQ